MSSDPSTGGIWPPLNSWLNTFLPVTGRFIRAWWFRTHVVRRFAEADVTVVGVCRFCAGGFGGFGARFGWGGRAAVRRKASMAASGSVELPKRSDHQAQKVEDLGRGRGRRGSTRSDGG